MIIITLASFLNEATIYLTIIREAGTQVGQSVGGLSVVCHIISWASEAGVGKSKSKSNPNT